MDPRYTGEMLRHLDKQNELLTDAYRSMSNELQKLQVEEEMLMCKFYEFMTVQGLAKKANDDTDMQAGGDTINDKGSGEVVADKQ